MTDVVVLLYVLVAVALFGTGVRVMHDTWLRAKLGPFASALSPQNKIWLEDLARSLGDDNVIVAGHTAAAIRLWSESPDAARQRLRLACEHVENVATPEILRSVRILAGLVRTVRIVPPPRPLATAAYQLAHTRGWAALARLAHWLGTTGADRVRVRLWFARRAFLTAARVFTRAARQALLGKHPTREARLTMICVATHDMKLAQDETVATAQHILIAFTAWQVLRETRLAAAQ